MKRTIIALVCGLVAPLAFAQTSTTTTEETTTSTRPSTTTANNYEHNLRDRHGNVPMSLARRLSSGASRDL